MALHLETVRLGRPAIILHGGAGTFKAVKTPEDAAGMEEALQRATAAGFEVLGGAGSAFDAVTEAVASLEDSGLFNSGRGAVPTTDGEVEFDAGVMDGRTGAVGSICAATYPANPVRAARAVAAAGGVPAGPILLAGSGADRFCAEKGLERMERQWLTRLAGSPAGGSEKGTVGAVAVDATGEIAAATSTGGRAGQLPGRVGDSPVPGAGVFADRHGVALSATGEGEAFLVAGFGHHVAWKVASGSSLEEALSSGLDVVGALSGSGGAVAVTPSGEVAAAFTTPAMARAWRSVEVDEARVLAG